MEDPARRLLNLTEARFRDVLAGRAELGGVRGPKAIQQALGHINLDREIELSRLAVKSGARSNRDLAVRKLKYLESAKRLKIHPRDWVLTRVPVLPPIFRPVSVMTGSKLPMVADPNLLYRELFDANKNLEVMSGRVTEPEEEREAVYDALKGVVGLGEPLHPKNQERQVKGILKHIFGSSPKHGVIQSKLLGTTTDLVGRAVITPDPTLDIDSVGVPENQAWEIYEPFIVRRMVRQGVPRAQAARALHDRSSLAREALLATMKERPVVVNRAPNLHRYGIMAFWPQLVADDTIHLTPLVTKGLGADFDGDAVSLHVMASDGAVRDAIDKMLPSRNLLSPANFKVHQLPSNEFVSGLFVAAGPAKAGKRARTFATAADAMRAYHRGELAADDPVEVVQ